ncbi:MAG: esterase-like activity of phytase family protein, partial [Chloroflexi bacterium]|nr:esterase-like activity of phytase family protein [Chloroflexota bacterium]
VAEYVYPIGPRTLVSEPADAGGGIGLNDLLYIGDGRFLSVERQWASGVTGGEASRPVQMYEVGLEGADNIIDVDALTGDEAAVSKRLVLDFDDLLDRVERIGSHEAVVFGPVLEDGRRTLILVEDNDFDRPTQVLAFAINE